jgi:1-pyrroline-4-hydroxy-2-carboxylate deaminase
MVVNWQGVYSALLTPFNANDTIDQDVFKINLNGQLDAGIDGIIIGGSLGEASSLLESEKMKRRVPVIMNIAEQSTKRAISFARDAEKNGANGLMLLPPMLYIADGVETTTYFKEVAKATSLPIIIYNNPYDYKIEVTLSMFEELAQLPTIQAVKESTRELSNLTKMKNRFGDRFKILCGVDTLALEELALGADGWISGLVDAFPAETVAIYKLIKAGDFIGAREIYRWFFPLLELDIHPKFVQYIKLAAKQNGIGSEYVRAPRLPLIGEERIAVLAKIENAIATRPNLQNYKLS